MWHRHAKHGFFPLANRHAPADQQEHSGELVASHNDDEAAEWFVFAVARARLTRYHRAFSGKARHSRM